MQLSDWDRVNSGESESWQDLEGSKDLGVKGLKQLLLKVVHQGRVRSRHCHRAHSSGANLSVSLLLKWIIDLPWRDNKRS